MTGVTEIDLQHQELVNMLHRLNDAVKNSESRESIYRLIDDVITYTRLHFETEERLMVQSGYSGTEWHKNRHDELIKDALSLKEKLDCVGEQMFTDWFNHWPFADVLAHIQYADQQVEDHIIQRGVK
jgi:hemerythrin-like metal-binding protein